MIALVGFEFQKRRERTAGNVKRISGDVSREQTRKRDEQMADLCPVHPARFLPQCLPQALLSVLTEGG